MTLRRLLSRFGDFRAGLVGAVPTNDTNVFKNHSELLHEFEFNVTQCQENKYLVVGDVSHAKLVERQ